MSNHGGKRKGAGRKPAPDGTKKQSYGTKLDPQVVEFLKSRSNAAETIETAIRRSRDWRDWIRKIKPQELDLSIDGNRADC